jgi:hypothetical protein
MDIVSLTTDYQVSEEDQAHCHLHNNLPGRWRGTGMSLSFIHSTKQVEKKMDTITSITGSQVSGEENGHHHLHYSLSGWRRTQTSPPPIQLNKSVEKNMDTVSSSAVYQLIGGEHGHHHCQYSPPVGGEEHVHHHLHYREQGTCAPSPPLQAIKYVSGKEHLTDSLQGKTETPPPPLQSTR